MAVETSGRAEIAGVVRLRPRPGALGSLLPSSDQVAGALKQPVDGGLGLPEPLHRRALVLERLAQTRLEGLHLVPVEGMLARAVAGGGQACLRPASSRS